jgi:hypothetical protein
VCGEVQTVLDDEVTKPLPIQKVRDMSSKKWPDMAFPLTVLYSPILRLRYRYALNCCCTQINLNVGKVLFSIPAEASNKLAVEIERLKVEPPLKHIYVQDSEGRKATEGCIQLFQDTAGELVSGIVYLPESEETPYSTLSVTLHELGHLLGLQHSDDPGSVMYNNSKARLQLLSKGDSDAIRKLYNNLK